MQSKFRLKDMLTLILLFYKVCLMIFVFVYTVDSKPSEDLPSKSLLSMIVNNDKPGQQNIVPGPTLSDGAIHQNLSSKLTTDKFDASSRLLPFPSPAPAGGIQEQYRHAAIPDSIHASALHHSYLLLGV